MRGIEKRKIVPEEKLQKCDTDHSVAGPFHVKGYQNAPSCGRFRHPSIGFNFTATLTPIYLAAEWPNLLRRDERHMPPLAFPILAGLLAGVIGCLVAVIIGSIQSEGAALEISVIKGVTRWRTVAYPWTILICGMTGVLSVLMLIGHYPDAGQMRGVRRYRQWASLSDGLILGAFTLALMLLVVFRLLVELVPQHYSWDNELVIVRPVLTAFFIGLLVPTWYRGNRELLKQEKRKATPVAQGVYEDVVSY